MNNTDTEKNEIVNPQSPALFNKKPKALEVMANRMNVDPTKLLSTLKNTVFKGATDDELLALVVVSNEYGLNPLLKEIYAFPKKGGGIVPMVPIDGWVKLMNRADNFDGIEFEYADGDNGKPVSCTAVIHMKNRSKAIRVTEYFAECFRNTDPWNGMPRRMLRHKALMQAARVGFGFSGITDEDEAKDQIDESRFLDSRSVVDAKAPVFAAKKEPLVDAAKNVMIDPPAAYNAPAAPVEGDKTKRFNAICQAHKLEIGEVLNYLGELGHPSFEDVPDRYLEIVENRPGQFASSVKAGAK